jgi:hypothetical protein
METPKVLQQGILPLRTVTILAKKALHYSERGGRAATPFLSPFFILVTVM